MTRGSKWLAIVLALGLAACSDDSNGPTPDGPAGGDTGTVDQGPSPDQGPAADLATGDTGTTDGTGSDGSGVSTFTIELTVDFMMLVNCQPNLPDTDCVGNIYWSVYDKAPPTDPNNPGTPMFQGVLKDGKKGSVITSTVPVAPKMWVAAFMDDDGNVDTASVKPDKGDPVVLSAASFTAQPGTKYTSTINFMLRLP